VCQNSIPETTRVAERTCGRRPRTRPPEANRQREAIRRLKLTRSIQDRPAAAATRPDVAPCRGPLLVRRNPWANLDIRIAFLRPLSLSHDQPRSACKHVVSGMLRQRDAGECADHARTGNHRQYRRPDASSSSYSACQAQNTKPPTAAENRIRSGRRSVFLSWYTAPGPIRKA